MLFLCRFNTLYISTNKRLKLVNRTEPHITRQQEQPHQDLDEKFTFAEYDLDKKRWICPRKKPELPPDIKSVTIHFNQHRGLKIFEELFCILMNKIVFILRGKQNAVALPKIVFFSVFLAYYCINYKRNCMYNICK